MQWCTIVYEPHFYKIVYEWLTFFGVEQDYTIKYSNTFNFLNIILWMLYESKLNQLYLYFKAVVSFTVFSYGE